MSPPRKRPHRPKWTVHYNIPGEFVGTGWEFFVDKDAAKERYDKLYFEGMVPSMRPYFDKCDKEHLGACHRMSREEYEDYVDQHDIEAAEMVKDEPTIPLEKVKKELGL